MCFNIEYSCHTITNIIHGRRLSLQLMQDINFLLPVPTKQNINSKFLPIINQYLLN